MVRLTCNGLPLTWFCFPGVMANEGKGRGKGPMLQGGAVQGVALFPPLEFPSSPEPEAEPIAKAVRRTGGRGAGSSRPQGDRRRRTETQEATTLRAIGRAEGSSLLAGIPCLSFEVLMV